MSNVEAPPILGAANEVQAEGLLAFNTNFTDETNFTKENIKLFVKLDEFVRFALALLGLRQFPYCWQIFPIMVCFFQLLAIILQN